jgi:cell division protease FtsH
MNSNQRNFWILAAIVLALALAFNMLEGPSDGTKTETLDYSAFRQKVTEQAIAKTTIKGDVVTGKYKNGGNFTTKVPHNAALANELSGQGIGVEAAEDSPALLSLLLSWFPMLLFIGFWIVMYRQMNAGNGRAMGFGRSKAKLTEKKGKVTFNDVAGVEEAKQEVQEIVDYLKDPQKFQRLGAKIPRGVLLIGGPGTGKTLLARAIAGEADVPFFSISGSDFVEMFVGVGASRVRDMFDQGRKNAPCIIFIDEIDAVGRHRGAGLGGGNDEREQTLNQLLVEMDGFEPNETIIIIAATNRPDVLDPALLRPGRFDRQVVVPNPDVKGREEILNVHLKKIPIAEDVNTRIIARGTPGFSGADLANVVNEAALLAARKGRRVVHMKEMEEAKDKIMMGAERKSMVMTSEERKLTAYHEGGHAVVAFHLPHSDPIHKATIVPRGRALGMVMRLPENDRISVSFIRLKADLAVGMGGRIAEEMIFGRDKITTGASSDIRMVTEMSRRMVTEWGFSEKLGTVAYNSPQQEVFLGHSVTQTQNISDATAQLIDQEIRKIIDEAYNTAHSILNTHREHLERVAQGLLEYETLSGEDIKMLIEGKKLDRIEEEVRVKKLTSLPTAVKAESTPPLAIEAESPTEEPGPDKPAPKKKKPESDA